MGDDGVQNAEVFRSVPSSWRSLVMIAGQYAYPIWYGYLLLSGRAGLFDHGMALLTMVFFITLNVLDGGLYR